MEDHHKIRVWDGEKFYYLEEDGFFWPEIEGGDCLTLDEVMTYNGFSEMEFCTGIKNKSGNLIYEGDLLRWPPKDGWEKINYTCFEVFFHSNDMADKHVGFQMNRTHHQGSIGGGSWDNFLPKNTIKMEKIGTIHENPELLEEK